MEPSTRIPTRIPGELMDLRRRRAELRESMGLLEDALAAPAGGGAVQWGERVHDAVADLSDDFIDHIVVTEGPDGLHHAILSGALRLTNAVTALAAEHPNITAEIAALSAATEEPVDADRVEAVRERATHLLGHLARHRQRGADLIYEAYQTDIGGGD
ncbi:MAG TPA: hypothetical protein VGN35_09135 [Jatrophihabitantaceae bacterium]|jgi:hypothetical protein|nr:hypothetical protein [Jatrophihabitantaceae bacterium]